MNKSNKTTLNVVIYSIAFLMVFLWLYQAKRQTDHEREDMNRRLQKIADELK